MLRNEFTETAGKSIEVRAAQEAPLTLWSDIRGPKHFVQFYRSEIFLVHSLAGYVTEGLKRGETCIVAATDKHHKMLEDHLSQDGSLNELRSSGRLITVDTDHGLAEIMSGDMLDEQKFRDNIEPVMIKASKRGGGIRVFCESVAVLAQRGNSDASLQLETFWNALREDYLFALFCAYPTSGFAGVPTPNRLHICDEHAVIIPDETYTNLKTGTARLRKIACLQQRVSGLEAELAEIKGQPLTAVP